MKQSLAIIGIVGITLISGCATPTGEIAASAIQIQERGNAIVKLLEAAERAKPRPAVLTPVKAAKAHAEAIVGECGRIQTALPGVQNVEPAWVGLAKSAALLVGAGLLIFAVVYFGVGKVVRPIMQMFGVWLDKVAVEDVRLDEKVLAGEMGQATAIGIKRTRKGYEQARKKLKSRPP